MTEIGTDILRAKMFLEKGELVAVPTETVYGLAANGLDPNAVAKIYKVKNRPQFNPLILHVASIEQARKWVDDIPESCLKLMYDFCPGPITFLLPKNELVPELVTAGSSLVAIRVPDHPLLRELLSMLDFPLAAPSANPSGYVSPVTAHHVQHGLNGRIPYILDGGPCTIGLESTIVGFENDAVVVHRLGAISAEQIAASTEKKVITSLFHAAPTAPGQLKSHYATRKPLFLGDIRALYATMHTNPVHSGQTGSKNSTKPTSEKAMTESGVLPSSEIRERVGVILTTLEEQKRVGVISFKTDYSNLADIQRILSPSGDLNEAASQLFRAMRELDNSDVDLILAERFPDTGIGRAINDRLERAAFKPN